VTVLNPTNKPSVPLHKQDWSLNTTPTVSVLVPTFNHEHFIAQCLDGILMQVTNFPVEIIVHDDASTDRTVEIVKAYVHRYPDTIKPVLQIENQHSRNQKNRPLMLKYARGDFVAGCDGDDAWLDPYKLTKQIVFLRENPEYVLSYHDAMLVDSKGDMIKASWRSKEKLRDYSKDEMRLKGAGMLTGTIVYRNVLTDFPPEYYLVENGDAFIPYLLAAHGGAKFQGEVEPLAYRQHIGGMWSSRTRLEKTKIGLQSYLQMSAYFVRIGEIETASHIIKTGLIKRIARFLKQTKEQNGLICKIRGLFK